MKQLTLSSQCRYDTRDTIGNAGVVYEFDIKIPPLHPMGIDCTQEEFDEEAEECLEGLAYALRKRYSWIGTIHRAGRSGGWLAIEDKKGLATREKLSNIIKMVEAVKGQFIRALKHRCPA